VRGALCAIEQSPASDARTIHGTHQNWSTRMTKRHKTEKPPWQPIIEEPAPFHTGVPPRDLIGERIDPPVTLDELDESELEDSVEAAPKAAPAGSAG
jgi:predicted alpha/beta hydrolase